MGDGSTEGEVWRRMQMYVYAWRKVLGFDGGQEDGEVVERECPEVVCNSSMPTGDSSNDRAATREVRTKASVRLRE